jgi:hypothetical protein
MINEARLREVLNQAAIAIEGLYAELKRKPPIEGSDLPIIAIKFHPSVDYDEKCCRRIVLSHDQLMWPQHDGCRRRDNVLDSLRLQSPKYGDAGNDLKIAGRQS